MTKVDRSLEWYEKARKLIPWGTQTGAKDPFFLEKYRGYFPLYMERGKGSHVWDIDGNEYIDYRASLGPIILGYAYEPVDNAVKAQIDKGILFSMASPLELELAQKVADAVPCAEMVRFMKTGGDANSAAVRLARVFTGREKILQHAYHGWHDTFMAGDDPGNLGIPAIFREYSTHIVFNDLDATARIVREKAHELACIIVNPCPYQLPEKGFLEGLKKLAHEYGMLLIFDEVKTGFRLALGGAQEYFGVTPDIAVFSKAMANGYPIAAYTGRRDVMGVLEKKTEQGHMVMISTTFAGETASMAAASATIDIMRKHDVHSYINRTGQKLRDGMASIFGECGVNYEINGVPSMFSTVLKESQEFAAAFQIGLLKRGILQTGAWEVSFSHSDDDIAATLQAVREALQEAKMHG